MVDSTAFQHQLSTVKKYAANQHLVEMLEGLGKDIQVPEQCSTVVFSVMLYGGESGTLKKQSRKNIEGVGENF